MAVALERPVISLIGLNPKRTGPYRRYHDLVDAYGDPGENYPLSMETRLDACHITCRTMAKVAVGGVLRESGWRDELAEPILTRHAP